VEPLAAVAVKVTDVPLAKTSVQSAPQLIPVPVTVPLPVPLFATVSVKVFRLKVAVQVMFPLSVTVPVLQPVPVHPANVESLAAVAASATDVPLAKTSVQSAPQLIPVPVTVPVPVPPCLRSAYSWTSRRYGPACLIRISGTSRRVISLYSITVGGAICQPAVQIRRHIGADRSE
jgi:hypothetical protein